MLNIFLFQVSCTKESYESPYGICGQVYEIWESKNETSGKYNQLELMHNAGIDWYRSDYPWSYIQPSQDSFDTGTFDALNEYISPYNMHFFPLVLYPPSWVDMSNKETALVHWRAFTQKLFDHFQNIEFYEIWSEPDGKSIDAEFYGKLLIAAHDEMKKVNKTMKTVYAGIGDFNTNYFNKSMQVPGAPEAVDILSIHTYRQPLMNFANIDEFINQIQWYPKYMKQNYDRDIDIWITEMGYSSKKQNWHDYLRWLMDVVTAILFEGKKQRIAYFRDTDFRGPGLWDQPSPVITETLQYVFGESVKNIDYEHIANLSVEEFPILILPFYERFPGDVREEIVDYVKRGGTIIFNEGFPATYDYTMKNGKYEHAHRDTGAYLERELHMRTIADWYNSPEKIPGWTSIRPYSNLSEYTKKTIEWPEFDFSHKSDSSDMLADRYFIGRR